MKKVKKIVHHLRQQPSHVKDALLHLLTVFFGIIIITIWVYSMSRSLSGTEIQASLNIENSPIGEIKEGLAESFDNSALELNPIILNQDQE